MYWMIQDFKRWFKWLRLFAPGEFLYWVNPYKWPLPGSPESAPIEMQREWARYERSVTESLMRDEPAYIRDSYYKIGEKENQ